MAGFFVDQAMPRERNKKQPTEDEKERKGVWSIILKQEHRIIGLKFGLKIVTGQNKIMKHRKVYKFVIQQTSGHLVQCTRAPKSQIYPTLFSSPQ